MIPPTRRRPRPSRFPVRCLPATVVALSAGCADPLTWNEPDWDDVLAREAKTFEPVDVPDATVEGPSALPDLAGDGPLTLSVEQAVVLALRENRNLAVQELTPVIVGAFEAVERGVFDPEVFAGIDFAREESVETARATGEQFGVTGDDRGVTAGVRQTLPSGTDVEFGLDQTRDASSRTPVQQTARFGLTVTQALLRGADPAANLARVRQAELDTLASRYELRGFTEAILAETEIAYWRYVLAGQEIAIFEESRDLAREQLDDINQRIEVGVLAPTQAAAARTEVALREQALINARSALTARRIELLRLVNPGPRDALTRAVVAVSEAVVGPAPEDDVADRVALAQQSRPDLNEARLRLEQNRLETVVTRNGLLPRLDFFVALGKTGFDARFAGSFENLDGETFDFAAGLAFSQFLGTQVAEGRHRAALASRQQAAAAVRNLEQLVAFEVRLAQNDAERLREQIDASKVTRELQEQTVEAERERFDVGASTALLVAQAQRDLLVARIAEVEAVISYRIALVRLYVVEGSLLERRGIRVAAG